MMAFLIIRTASVSAFGYETKPRSQQQSCAGDGDGTSSAGFASKKPDGIQWKLA